MSSSCQDLRNFLEFAAPLVLWNDPQVHLDRTMQLFLCVRIEMLVGFHERTPSKPCFGCDIELLVPGAQKILRICCTTSSVERLSGVLRPYDADLSLCGRMAHSHASDPSAPFCGLVASCGHNFATWIRNWMVSDAALKQLA